MTDNNPEVAPAQGRIDALKIKLKTMLGQATVRPVGQIDYEKTQHRVDGIAEAAQHIGEMVSIPLSPNEQ